MRFIKTLNLSLILTVIALLFASYADALDLLKYKKLPKESTDWKVLIEKEVVHINEQGHLFIIGECFDSISEKIIREDHYVFEDHQTVNPITYLNSEGKVEYVLFINSDNELLVAWVAPHTLKTHAKKIILMNRDWFSYQNENATKNDEHNIQYSQWFTYSYTEEKVSNDGLVIYSSCQGKELYPKEVISSYANFTVEKAQKYFSSHSSLVWIKKRILIALFPPPNSLRHQNTLIELPNSWIPTD